MSVIATNRKVPVGGREDWLKEYARQKLGLQQKEIITAYQCLSTRGTNGLGLAINVSSAAQTAGNKYYTTPISAVAGARIGYSFGIPGIAAGVVNPGDIWFMEARFSVGTTMVAATRAGLFSLSATTPVVEVGMGINGGSSTSKFTLVGASGSDMVSSVSIDTNVMHTLIAWRDGASTYFSVDDEPVVKGNVAPVNNSAPHLLVWDTAGAAIRGLNWSEMFLATSRP